MNLFEKAWMNHFEHFVFLKREKARGSAEKVWVLGITRIVGLTALWDMQIEKSALQYIE